MITCNFCGEEIDPRETDLAINSRPGIFLDYHNECREAWEVEAKKITGKRPEKEKGNAKE